MIKETSSNQAFRRDSENRMVRFLSPSVYYNVDTIVSSHLFTVNKHNTIVPFQCQPTKIHSAETTQQEFIIMTLRLGVK